MLRDTTRRIVGSGHLLLLFVWVVGWPFPAVSAPAIRSSFEFQPGVVVDPQRSTAYLMNPQGGIDAVELITGNLLWTSTAAAMPLAMHGEQLIAQVEQPGRLGGLTLAFLATRASGRLIRTHEIDLPGGVAASIDDDGDSSFLLRAVERPEGLFLTWHYNLRKRGGVHPSDEEKNGYPRRSGAFRFDPVSGIAREVPAEEARRRRAGDLPPGLAAQVTAGELPDARWFSRGDTGWALVERSGDINGTRALLRRWDFLRGDEQLDVLLFDDRDLGYRYPSADERHLLASRPRLSTDPRYERFEWVIFSLDSGARIADLTLGVPGARFFLYGSLLIHEVTPYRIRGGSDWIDIPRQIRAVTLDGGDEVWSRPIRDPRYRGASPPSASGQSSRASAESQSAPARNGSASARKESASARNENGAPEDEEAGDE